MDKPVIVWFRNDLRLSDHPALAAAVKTSAPLIFLYILSEEEGEWPLGGASRFYLHHALLAFQKAHPKLVIRKGKPNEVLTSLIKETQALSIYCGKRYESYAQKLSVPVHAFNTALLYEPGEILNKEGKPYTVFTPYYKSMLQEGCEFEISPVPALKFYEGKVASLSVEELSLLPKEHWEKKMEPFWLPCGEKAALTRLNQFLDKGLANYSHGRDFPADAEAVSHLSAALHFGEISPRTIWKIASQRPGSEAFLRQLVWRDFAYQMLYFFPHTTDKPLKEAFNRFPWRNDPEGLQAWQRGLTGYPLIDAGMRQLWQTGWMHNRVRMAVASFLVKDLLIPWQEGARWFWDTLVDADLANNSFGWQWCAGSGADAAPYFRIFNPILQGEKFDPEGEYVRRYVPELNHLPNEWIHRPFEAPDLMLRAAGVVLGKNYPYPIVDHAKARERALHALKEIA